MKPASRVVRAGASGPSGGITPPLDRSTTFERWPETGAYGRDGSGVAVELEAALGDLEAAEALCFASGMSAWAILCLAVLRPGAAVAIPTSGYWGVEALARDLLEPWGVEVRRYDPRRPDELPAAVPGARLVLVETPSNPHLAVVDIGAAAAAVHAAGALLVVDNTVATPLVQRPLDFGADLTWQSATKYLGGHSDVLAGVLATRDRELVARVRGLRTGTGGVLSPDGAWLVMRGLRTLAIRLERQSGSALELARRLAAHPAVVAVHYPGLPADPGHEVAARQMHGGFGGLLAFELPDAAAADRVCDRLALVRRATSLGSVESLIERRARVEPEGRVAPGLLRLSVGLEDVEDLWDDLEGALSGT
ncbi:MAG TPA: PLP-dependent transferase [Miltoncostaeaceae bacterium]|nr:PLP-dependent transferase [Miltoncostaeaceae bacterium]